MPRSARAAPVVATGPRQRLPEHPRAQPRIAVGDDLHLRPWRDTDADVVVRAFACPDIRRWHLRTFDDRDEALSWIAGWGQSWTRETDAS